MAQLVDSHCHFTTVKQHRREVNNVKSDVIRRCIMSCNIYDWSAVRGEGDIIAFGVHPWYSHLFYIGLEKHSKDEHYRKVLKYSKDSDEVKELIKALPDPISLEEHIQGAKSDKFDQVKCIGEIGIDRLFRLPEDGFFNDLGDATARPRLTRVTVKVEHQVAVFRRMCQLAVETGLAVSIHAVKCQELLFNVCRDELGPYSSVTICLHSYMGSVEFVRNFWLRNFPYSRLFLSISFAINLQNKSSALELIKSVPLQCLLSETDLTIDTVPIEIQIVHLEKVLGIIQEAHSLKSLQDAKCLVYNNFCRLFHF
ncbi:HGR063Wp [Eremothecium sinecaudum]|uniref:HGR063Wp n=1 Tax=Eremothecium sinecaudum TaxID=45286 RepID=A0A0X8HVQ6_9SACH|nr:HGR063Wp [Eremothecium sinecaudum]AMD22402.1 HGR063Wp [Eremothecium sinecaudum]